MLTLSPRRNHRITYATILLVGFLGLSVVGSSLAQDSSTQKATTKDWQADRAPNDLKIATWNLEWFFDDFKANNRSDVAKEQSAPDRAQWDWRVGNFAAAIAKFEPTILAVK